MRWDCVVIGSGVGGLTAAVALARAGLKVLVLEQHYLPGGWTQSFSLEQYRFSPGVHYVGDLHRGGGVRRIIEGLGLSADLEFNELDPDGFDHVLVGNERFDVPRGLDRYIARLDRRFPHERTGIRRYFDTLCAVTRDVQRVESLLTFPEVLTVPFRAPSLVRWGFRSLEGLLERNIRDPLLRAVLAAQCGNHGLPPSRVSLPVHAVMAAHYFNGGFYPRGGAKRIPLALIKQLRRDGGQIKLRTPVAKILLERGRAAGVETLAGERISARMVISNADPAVTYGRLLPVERSWYERLRVSAMEYSVSLVSVFCAVDMDLAAMGYDSGNYWWYRDPGVGRIYEHMAASLPGAAVDGLFLTVTTLKDPESYRGRHVIEMFTFAPYAPFARWRNLQPGARGEEYEALKRALGDKMLAAAENVIPGITRAVRFLAVGTPVTSDYYCNTHRGASYGTAKTPFQVGPFAFPIESPVPGLYNCGASTLSHGVGGAAISGLVAAQKALRRSHVEDLLGPADGSLRIHSAEQLRRRWAPRAERADREEPGPLALHSDG